MGQHRNPLQRSPGLKSRVPLKRSPMSRKPSPKSKQSLIPGLDPFLRQLSPDVLKRNPQLLGGQGKGKTRRGGLKITPVDKLFSEFIRRRAIKRVGGCESCLTPKPDIEKEDGSMLPGWKRLQCAHFWGRGKGSTRCDVENAFGLCGACHIYFGAHPAEFTEWYIRERGQRAYDLLQVRARSVGKTDENLIRLFLKEELAKL